MAGLADILQDPNYVNANEATKQAIFSKYAPLDPNYADANPDTQKAIQAKFGLVNNSGIPAPRQESPNMATQFGRTAASALDTTVGSVIPFVAGQVAYPFIRLTDVLPGVNMPAKRAEEITGKLTSAIDQPFGKAFGVTQTPEYKGEASNQVMQFISENINKGADWVSEKTGIPASDVVNMAQTLAIGAPKGIKMATPYVREGAATIKGAIQEIPPIKAAIENATEKKIAQSWERAPQIEAAQLAQKYGIALDPALSNPTARNRLKSAVVGEMGLDTKLATHNEPKWAAIVKDDLGLGQNSVLDKKAFDTARAAPEVAGPYEAVRNIPSVVIPETTLQSLDRLYVEPLYGDTGQAAKSNAFVDKLKADLAQGGDGTKLLDSIRSLRQDAQGIYHAEKAGNPITPEQRANANAKMGAASALEDAITASLESPKARTEFNRARTRMAQIYDLESATNFATGKVDPSVLAKMAAEGKPMTGVVGDIAAIAANYPEVSRLGATNKTILPRMSRATVGGLTGSILGNILIPGGVGAAIGMGTGALASDLAGRISAKRMTSPEYQAARAIPKDYRPPVNNLRPVEPGQSNIVPFNPVNALVEPEIRPNFVFGKSEPLIDRADINPSSPFGPRQIGNDTPADVIARRRAEDARQTRMAKMAEAEALAAEGKPFSRTPTRGEVILDIDPITGKLLPQTSQGIRGATLETFQDYMSTLGSAVDKVGAKQNFNLTAAEKIAFDKTKFYIAEVSPGFEKLSDKAIVDRMLDRKWVEDAVVKAREKSAAFYQLAVRARDAERMGARADTARNMELARQAEEASGQMKTTLDLLEDRLVKLRADDSRKRQGPKTQGAIRNNLTANQNRNALRDKE
jgi:hypothetical protein